MSQTVLHKPYSIMHKTKRNILMQGSNVHSKTQVVAHHYHIFSVSQYFLQIKVRAQTIIYPHIKNDSIFTHNGIQFKFPESILTLTLTRMNTMHELTHRFAHIYQSSFVLAHSRSKTSFQGL